MFQTIKQKSYLLYDIHVYPIIKHNSTCGYEYLLNIKNGKYHLLIYSTMSDEVYFFRIQNNEDLELIPADIPQFTINILPIKNNFFTIYWLFKQESELWHMTSTKIIIYNIDNNNNFSNSEMEIINRYRSQCCLLELQGEQE